MVGFMPPSSQYAIPPDEDPPDATGRHRGRHRTTTKRVLNTPNPRSRRVCAQLNVSRNRLGAAGTSAISKGLRVNRALRHLNIRNNDVGAEGAAAMGEALRENAELRALNLRDNGLGPVGTMAIAQALCVNAAVTSLSLAQNEIGHEGALALAVTLRMNSHLAYLNLAGACRQKKGRPWVAVGPSDVEAMLKATTVNCCLTCPGADNPADKHVERAALHVPAFYELAIEIHAGRLSLPKLIRGEQSYRDHLKCEHCGEPINDHAEEHAASALVQVPRNSTSVHQHLPDTSLPRTTPPSALTVSHSASHQQALTRVCGPPGVNGILWV